VGCVSLYFVDFSFAPFVFIAGCVSVEMHPTWDALRISLIRQWYFDNFWHILETTPSGNHCGILASVA
jgi:hypothetical protein